MTEIEQEIVKKLKKRCIDLAIAFENLDQERMYWRRQAGQLRGMIENMQRLMKPYEGENNVRKAPVEVKEFVEQCTQANA